MMIYSSVTFLSFIPINMHILSYKYYLNNNYVYKSCIFSCNYHLNNKVTLLMQNLIVKRDIYCYDNSYVIIMHISCIF